MIVGLRGIEGAEAPFRASSHEHLTLNRFNDFNCYFLMA